MYSWDYMHGPWWGGIVIGLWMLFFVLLVAVLAWLLIRRRHGCPWLLPPEDAPLEIARKRFARGEISREEFQQIRKDLQE